MCERPEAGVSGGPRAVSGDFGEDPQTAPVEHWTGLRRRLRASFSAELPVGEASQRSPARRRRMAGVSAGGGLLRLVGKGLLLRHRFLADA